ncbi:MmpS family transport accessory protein [Mycobacterium shimoidei]|uniref:Putative transport accessory protein MmpS3 n=1 Tax=Mycobacterium shimoidei TaxID=29313 RepID=A0A1E3TFW7_MYCSH|nr:MmpS family transport accessory protein [Mycobacterium shimoidei]ODR12888.1 hypothetical protein BHQ16_13450 [Mycobacterium shimoidei]SRX96334.1 putative transport accessory protein MmpS3 [Mycobacterium shimoidei]
MNHLDTDIQDYPDELVYETYPDDDFVEPVDQRWRPVALIATVVLVLAVIATVVVLNGGDSTSTTATVVPPTRTVTATPRTTPPPSTSLPPETVTTVTPPPRQSTPTPTAEPPVAPSVVPPPEVAAPEISARTVIYQVTGTKPLFDLVNIVYTDAQGLPHTDFNVSLPWSKTIVLNPGVQTKSVVATSITGRLNCVITDAQGHVVAASANNAIIATCTR